jgi:hypothetical protein
MRLTLRRAQTRARARTRARALLRARVLARVRALARAVAPVTPARQRRWVLAETLLAIIFVPLPGSAAGQQSPCTTCRAAQPANLSAERWAVALPGNWAVDPGATGTVPESGQAYVAAGNGVVVVGLGLTVAAYRLSNGAPLWQLRIDAPAGTAIMSVRAWKGVVTAGIDRPNGSSRSEAVIDTDSGTVLRQYPAAVFGGAVEATTQYTDIVGTTAVTSYDNSTGRVRWQRRTDAGQAWRTDGATLYVTQSAGGYLGAGPVTGLQVINLSSGAERPMASPTGQPFPGTLAGAAQGDVLFTSASGVTAYSGTTGDLLWSAAGAVPEGADPVAGLIYLTSPSGALTGVNPRTGVTVTSVPGSATTGSAGMYAVRGGVALGLDSGAEGEAWGYSVGAGRVTWTAPGLPWPHYFSDLSGVGGSAAASGVTAVIAACPHPAPASASPPPASTIPASTAPASTTPASTAPGSTAPAAGTPTGSPAGGGAATGPAAGATPSSAPPPAPRSCTDPELVDLNV